jgi:hypothetical protein
MKEAGGTRRMQSRPGASGTKEKSRARLKPSTYTTDTHNLKHKA